MARKVRGFERLDAPALFAIAYGEIGSSIYVALGIVAASALGLTPVVLAATGLVFCLVALSYAEGTAAMPETGGAATFTRRAYNDLIGFVTGWALFLDYLIVIALSALFLPHYVGAALRVDSLRDRPWDIVVAVGGHRRDRDGAPRPQDAAPPTRARRRAARPRRPEPDRAARARAASSRRRRSSTGWRWLRARTGSTTCCSRSRSGSSRTPASRPSRTSPRRRASPAAPCPARSSRRSGSWSPDRARGGRRGDRVPGRRTGRPSSGPVAGGAARRHRDGVPGRASRGSR